MSTSNRLRGKVILVTGAGSGIGAASVNRLVSEGATVVGADINERSGIESTSRHGQQACFHALDVTDESSWRAVMDFVEHRFGRLNGVANIAGVAAEVEDLESCTLESWNQVLRVNLDGVFLGCREAVRMMRESGGAIVNIASIIGMIGDGNMVAYSASKGGVRLLSRSIAVYCCAHKLPIRCNSVHPGYIETPMVEHFLDSQSDPAAARRALIAKHPLGRLGKAEEVAALVAFALSDEASFVTGSELTVDGGYVTA